MSDVDFSTLLGAMISKIEGMSSDSDEVVFHTYLTGNNLVKRKFRMFHEQDCCETVRLEDVCGDPADLLHTPILLAEERSDGESEQPRDKYDESYTWTFYELRTIKGSVTLRWYGTSNGYYSESVDFEEIL